MKKMKLEGALTLLVDSDYTRLEIQDRKSGITFVTAQLTPEQLCQALSRLAHTTIEIEVSGLENVGKAYEIKDFEFEVDPKIEYGMYKKDQEEKLIKLAESKCPKGWYINTYFHSQNSFEKRNGVTYARTHIYRWVEDDLEEKEEG